MREVLCFSDVGSKVESKCGSFWRVLWMSEAQSNWTVVTLTVVVSVL